MEKMMNKFGVPAIYIIAFAAFLIPTFMTLFSSGSITDLNSSYYKNAVSSTNTYLITSYIFFVVVVIAILLGGIFEIASDPKASLKTIIGLAGILILGIIAFGVSNNEVTEMYTKMKVDKFMSQFVESTLILSYWLFLIAIVAIIYTEIRSALS